MAPFLPTFPFAAALFLLAASIPPISEALSAALSAGTVLVTVETPSTNLVLKMQLALLNMPSYRDTTMNWEYGKCARIMRPMFCVWLRSSAASTSSRM